MTNLVVLTKPASMITINSVIAVLTSQGEHVGLGTVGTVQMEGVRVSFSKASEAALGSQGSAQALPLYCSIICVTVFSSLVFLMLVFGVFAVSKDLPMP